MSADWQSDAELAGTLYRKAKPYTAMLIARSVEPDAGNPVESSYHGDRVSAREFADHSGISHPTVMKYLRTWQAMAEAGIVPFPADLEPGQDVEVPDQKTWTYYYREANPPKPKKPKDPSPTDEAIDLRGRVDLSNQRVRKALEMAHGTATVAGKFQPAVKRISEALTDIGLGANPNRAYVSLVVAFTDLVAELSE